MKLSVCIFLVLVASVALAADPRPISKLPERRMADLALGKYKQDLIAARKPYDDAIAKARKQLNDNYKNAINDCLKHGAAGLDLANQLSAELKEKVGEAIPDDLPSKGDDLYAPSRDEVAKMLTTGTWYLFWNNPNRDKPTVFTQNADGTFLESGTSTWVLEKRWVMHIKDHLLIPIDETRFRGFHIPSDSPFNLYRDPK